MSQDIIAILPENNPIKQKYYEEKKYYNFKEYIKDLELLRINNINNYKISIIYTFSRIDNIIERDNAGMEFMISEITTENKLKFAIDDIKNRNLNDEKNKFNIIIHFEQFNSNKIQFISDYINNYYKDDEYNYIFLIHIQRSFYFENKESDPNKERIYSIPNINNNINQLFIDNLQVQIYL